jgi:hypothetical protein
VRRDGFYHSAFGLQKPNRTLLIYFRNFPLIQISFF